MKQEVKVICENKKAYFDYEIKETIEAGVKLKGYEVKALREGKGNIKSSFVSLLDGIPKIKNFQINRYSKCSITNIDPKRDKELLLSSKEIQKIEEFNGIVGQTVVPLRVYFNGALIKIEIGLVKGKKKYEKREKIKKRDVERKLKRRFNL